MPDILLSDRIKGAIWGFVTGDAFGLPVKNHPRVHRTIYPIDTMTGWGTHNLPPGHWSDKTSILLNSIHESIHSNLDRKSFFNSLNNWYFGGQWNSDDRIIEISEPTRFALENYVSNMKTTGHIVDEKIENGSDLIGISLPVVLHNLKNKKINEISLVYGDMVGSIYQTPVTIMGLSYFHSLLMGLLINMPVRGLKSFSKSLFEQQFSQKPHNKYLKNFSRIIDSPYNLKRDELISDQEMVHVLECSLWAFLNSKSFEEALTNAVNLGHQTDTICACTGALAGAHYGFPKIPENWLEYVSRRNEIHGLVQRLLKKIFN